MKGHSITSGDEAAGGASAGVSDGTGAAATGGDAGITVTALVQ